jgi:ADP-ribosylation factor-like protein 8
MDVTMIGLQNAGKTSLLRVLAVCPSLSKDSMLSSAGWRFHHRVRLSCCPRSVADFTPSSIPTVGFNMKKLQKGHVTLKWYG